MVMSLQAAEQPFERVRLAELDIGVAVKVFYTHDYASYGGYAGKATVRFIRAFHFLAGYRFAGFT